VPINLRMINRNLPLPADMAMETRRLTRGYRHFSPFRESSS
jgi:hypothetical protein